MRAFLFGVDCDVDNGSVLAQEEIFGPVLCVLPYEDGGTERVPPAPVALSVTGPATRGRAATVQGPEPVRGESHTPAGPARGAPAANFLRHP
ncbi:hypothetical protein Shyhy01_21770 [Streptomyces hygroscopicus subsp. hygroscopicus]|nr:hypothetical protein Shyhy01_21770 [Streptomyces hygroscopicus subsp. hygroscopicus]